MSTTIFILPVILALISWGFSSLMRTIGILSGWNPKRTGWVSGIAYFLTFILAVVLLITASSYEQADKTALTFFYLILGTGLFSPLINLIIKWLFVDALTEAKAGKINSGIQQKLEVQDQYPSITVQPKVAAISSTTRKPIPELDASRIFISYRRSDSADISGRIYDRLVGRFGKEFIFKDVDSIPLGLDFKEYLDKKVGECKVMLAVIGDRWLDSTDSSGKKRIMDPADFVRIEIQSALERGIPVIPLLVRGIQMPNEESLPASLQKLAYRNGIPIRPDPDFHRDMDRLISALEKYVS